MVRRAFIVIRRGEQHLLGLAGVVRSDYWSFLYSQQPPVEQQAKHQVLQPNQVVICFQERTVFPWIQKRAFVSESMGF